MVQQDIRTTILDWFEHNTSVSPLELKDHTHANYMEAGWIDSFQFIELLSYLERTFSLSFSNDEFQDRSFATIDGLVSIIDKKKNG